VFPNFLRLLSGILAHSSTSTQRAIALIIAFELFAFEYFPERFELPLWLHCHCWAGSILSYRRCGNRLPASTGGAQVTGGGLKVGGARGFKQRIHPGIETRKWKLEKGEEKDPREVNSRQLKVER